MVLNHSFSVNQTTFFGEATNGLFFFTLWPKSSPLKFESFIFFDSLVFRFGSHSLALLVQAGLARPIWTAASTRYIAAATWLHVSSITAIHVLWQVLNFAVFSSIIQSLWNGSFNDWDFLHSLWWYSIYFLKYYGIAKAEAILIYSNCMLYYSYSH